MRLSRLVCFFGIAPLGAILFVPAAIARPFIVLSYNVENWLTPDRRADSQRRPVAPKPESEKAAVVSTIVAHRPAVLGIIEMGGRADLEDLRARLKTAGLDYPHVEWHEGFDANRHVALLSRFPIVARDSQDLVTFDLAGLPQGMPRGILDATVEPEPGYRVRVIGLHLKSRRAEPGVDQEALRAKEAWFVHQYVARILVEDPRTRVLVFGDLNDTKDQYPIRQIIGSRGTPDRLSDVPLEDGRGERWTYFYKAADEYARIDYFLASPALWPEIDRKKSGIDDSIFWSAASDHRAIYLTINPPSR